MYIQIHILCCSNYVYNSHITIFVKSVIYLPSNSRSLHLHCFQACSEILCWEAKPQHEPNETWNFEGISSVDCRCIVPYTRKTKQTICFYIFCSILQYNYGDVLWDAFSFLWRIMYSTKWIKPLCTNEISEHLLYFALCSHHPVGHHTLARFHRLAPWNNVSIRIKLGSTAQQLTSSLHGASTNQ